MSPDWAAVEREVVQHLQTLIRMDTTNPPGNELPAAEYLADVLRGEGIEAEVVESAPGRGNVVARLRGDGSARPLLLMSHLDVVPAEADKWEHPPFAAELVDGVIWGRGAVDTKNLTAVQLMLMLLLKREGVPLKRDVILAATADEEAGGLTGMGWLVEQRPELLEAEYAINEGGGFGLEIGGRRAYVCQTAEKGVCWMRLTAQGKPGHGSIPKGDNAVATLAEAIARLSHARLPLHVVPTVREFVQQLARLLPFPQSFILPLVLSPVFEPLVAKALAREETIGPLLRASVRNTATPTVLSAGSKTNVIPSVAEAQVDGRLIPGQTPDDLIREIRPYVGEKVRIDIIGTSEPSEAGYQTPLYSILAEALAEEDPGAVMLPFMITGSTDGRFLAKRGVKVYGFCPMKQDMDVSPLEMAHGHNERISVANLVFGVRVLYKAAVRLCS